MIKLKIINIDNYIYNLEDEKGKKYIFNLEFMDVENKIDISDFLYFSSELLDPMYEGYSKSYTFSNLNSKYGKRNLKEGDIDIIKVEQDGKEILLKRIYG